MEKRGAEGSTERLITSYRDDCKETGVTKDARIHWLKILIGGFLAEASVFAVVIPVFMTSGPRGVLYAAPVASLVMCFIFGWLVASRVESRPVLHGMLVGVIATLLYVALTRGRPEPPAYLLAHALKMLGGATGGAVARWKRPVTLRHQDPDRLTSKLQD
jgi:VIT1/CCC1 family predicted Fe2+/Mn2+ transporter